MEKKKLLLVAISVGIVLIILISIPLVLVRQGSASSRKAASTGSVRDYVVVTDPPEAPPINEVTTDAEPEPAEPPQVQVSAPEPVPQRPAEVPRVTITVPPPSAVAVPDARTVRPTPTPRPAAPQRPATPAATTTAAPAATTPATPAPAAATSATPKTPATATPARTQQTTEPAASQVRTQTNYWVQTGAFSTMSRAEGVKESLAAQGIPSAIDNPEINGRTLYRVRVGPWVNETEANWWLALVQSIDGFADSQVRQSQVVVQ